MCTSTDDCFCHEQVRHSRSPNCSYAQTSMSSAEIVSGGSCRTGVAKKHLLERVAAQAEPERLQRDHLAGRDVPQVDPRAEVLAEPGLRGLGRRLPDDVVDRELVRDLLDQAGAHVAVPAEDPRAA